MKDSCRATKLIVDVKSIEKNIEIVQKMIGNDVEIMPILKANGYGTHINYCLSILNKFNNIGVSLVDEAITIRNVGYEKNILVLYPPVESEIKSIIDNNLCINGSNLYILQKINTVSNKKIKIHIEIETGMGRTGVQLSKLPLFLEELKKLKNIEVVGAFTHFASSSKDISFTKIQIERFEQALKIIEENNITLKYIHVCNSGAIFTLKDYLYNMVRIGILIYGYYPNEKFKDTIKLYPSMTLKTKISLIKTIEVGDTVGYNKNFIADRKTVIGTIPFGFGDGLIGLDTGDPYVIINNEKAKIVGICMDNMMIDITDIKNVDYDTDVYIWDNNNLTVDEVASWCKDLCSYEILSSLSERIPRIIVGDDNEKY